MTDSPFATLEASLTAIDPSLTYVSSSTTPNSTDDRSNIQSPHDSSTNSEQNSPPIRPDQPTSSSSRTHSQPAEPFQSWRSPPHRLPRHPYPQHEQRSSLHQKSSSSLRYRPYDHKTRPQAPTSAPSSSVGLDVNQQSQAVDGYAFVTHQDQTTLVMGILTHLDVLTRQCEDMRRFINSGFSDGYGSHNERSKIEQIRLTLRNWNRTNTTELDEPLKPLPVLDDGLIPSYTPTTGRMVQWLDHKGIADLLDLYDLPFVPSMFLYEKKAIYLSFVGASRALMHRVLDDQPSVSVA